MIRKRLWRWLTMAGTLALATGAGAGGFEEDFQATGALEETGHMENSASADWWLNSGARLRTDGGEGATVQGYLAEDDPWRLLYAESSPIDTDGGYRPQNLFRLVTRDRWASFRQELRFRIRHVDGSSSSTTPTPGRWWLDRGEGGSERRSRTRLVAAGSLARLQPRQRPHSTGGGPLMEVSGGTRR